MSCTRMNSLITAHLHFAQKNASGQCWCLSSKLSPVSADLIHKTHQNISSYALDLSHFTCKKIYKFLSVSSPPQPVGPKKYVCLFVFVFICLYLFILQAEAALQRGEVPVGCLLVHKNKTVIGTGKNCVNETKNVSIVSVTQVSIQTLTLIFVLPWTPNPSLYKTTYIFELCNQG